MGFGGSSFENGFPISEVKPEHTTIVNSLFDLPDPLDLGDGLGLAHRCEGSFRIGKNIVTPYPLAPKSNGGVFSLNLLDNTIIYSGSGSFLRTNPTNSWSLFRMEKGFLGGVGGSQLLDFEGTQINFFTFEEISVFSFDSLGFIKKQRIVKVIRIAFDNFNEGITFDDNIVNILLLISTETTSVVNGSHINILGINTFSTEIIQFQLIPIAGDSAFYVDPNYTGFLSLNIGNVILDYGGKPFSITSLDNTSKKVASYSIRNIPDSKILGSFGWFNNNTETVLTYEANDYDIVSFSDVGNGEIEVLTTVAHNISNGQKIWIIGSYYDGEYIATNVGSTSFNVIALFNPAALNQGVVSTGWEKISGDTFAIENERMLYIDSNQLVFNSIEKSRIKITLTSSVKRGAGSGTPTFQLSIFKNLIPIYNENNNFYISNVDVNDTTPRNATISFIHQLQENDSISVYVRRTLGNGNLILLNGTLVID